jgi:hypothetical protein
VTIRQKAKVAHFMQLVMGTPHPDRQHGPGGHTHLAGWVLHRHVMGRHPERAIVFTVEAWDANCPQHIRPRTGADADATTIAALQRRIDALEAENRALRQQVGA